MNQELRHVLEITSEKTKEMVEIFMAATPELQQRMLDSVHSIMSGQAVENSPKDKPASEHLIVVKPSSSELIEEFTKALSLEKAPPVSEGNKTLTGPTPEQEEALQKSYQEALSRLSKEPQEIRKTRKEISYIVSGKGADQRAARASDQVFNVLCLCPNCHTLMKHGRRKLGDILVKAESVGKEVG